MFLDDSARALEQMAVSAGIRGAQLVLRPEDYIRGTGALVGPLGRGPA